MLRRRREDGAAAVEFALVVPLMLLLVFGAIQYGLFFNDLNAMRQGVRESARSGVVENFTYTGCNQATNAEKLICATGKQTDSAFTATRVYKIYAPDGWVKGKPLRVCAAAVSRGGVGLAPLPNGGAIRTLTQMVIEQEASKASWTNVTPPTDPTGGTWSWC